MRISQSAALPPDLAKDAQVVGQLMARLRVARKVKQADAALRAGLSRNTAYRLERGDPGVAIGQILRYLQAVAPGTTLLDLLSASDPALIALAEREKHKRVRDMSASDAQELNF